MKLYKIDNMKRTKTKLYMYVKYARKYDCFDQMPEIMELYASLKQQGEITAKEFSSWLDKPLLERVI